MKLDIDKLRPGRELDALVAEQVMGWKDVKSSGKSAGATDYRGKRPDKLGRLRVARVPPYSTDHGQAALIETRIKELKLSRQYEMELSKITHAQGLPFEWASPDQLCRAALKVLKRPRLSRVK